MAYRGESIVCSGVVKQGKIVLEAGAELPEGATVRIEVLSVNTASPAQSSSARAREQWLADWRQLAREATAAWNSPKSAVEVISEMRR